MNVEKLKTEVNRRLELYDIINVDLIKLLSMYNGRPIPGTKLTRLKGFKNELFSSKK